MNEEKCLEKQLFSLGQLFRYVAYAIRDKGPTEVELSNAEKFPFAGITKMITLLHKVRHVSLAEENTITHLLANIDFITMDEYFNTSIPLELRSIFYMGYYCTLQSTPFLGLKAIRAGKGFTQVQLAELSGIQCRRLQAYESGENVPSVQAAKKLATALNCSIEELF